MRKIIFVLLIVFVAVSCMQPSTRIESSQIVYSGDSLRHVRFPIGGIGTGDVLLGGRGEIHELEIFNRAHQDEIRPYMTFFSLWVKEEGKEPVKRILERELLNDFPNGFGVPRQQLSGIPRFTEIKFIGQYPIANLLFNDANVPVKVKLEAFNPYIPLDVKNSSLPVAIFNWTFTNTSKNIIDLSLCMSMGNPLKYFNHPNFSGNSPSTSNSYFEKDNTKGIAMKNILNSDSPNYGEVDFFTSEKEVDVQTQWYQGGWWDESHIFWDDFSDDGRLKVIKKEENNNLRKPDVSSILVPKKLAPGESVTIPFYISWYIPNRIPEESVAFGNDEAKGVEVENYYAKAFSNAKDVAAYLLSNIDSLTFLTKKFHSLIAHSSFPDYIIDAVSANTAIMKTNVFMRTGDAHFHGFEGIGLNAGCCAGNCTHVYNYAQTMASLFPSIERDMRETAYLYETFNNGYQCFRTPFPIGKYYFKNVAADGQMGNIIRVYREWKYSGDNVWLTKLWPQVKKVLEFAWKGVGETINEYPWMKNCSTPWDTNKEGVLRGEQQNTYDCTFYGPNMMTGSCYLGALKACAEMAEAMGEQDKAKEYSVLFEKGKKKYNDLLWNGEYYIQKVELIAGVNIPEKLKSPDSDLPKYQYGEGCLSDQMLGQYLAFNSGLGYIIDKEKVHKTLESIFKYNYVKSFREFENVQRVYALNNESGLVICTWPKGNREKIPFPYADETWTGIEYQVAASLIYEGFVDEGLTLVKAVRGRYSGFNRNPYAEIESGFYYARAMASWSVLMALSGYQYNGVEKSITFQPKINKDNFNSFWSCGTAWGNFEQSGKEVKLTVVYGQVKLKEINLNIDNIKKISLNNKVITFENNSGHIIFTESINIKNGHTLIIN